jgi:DNA-directed RNA polymerase subunit RPC12/RpoP
MMADGIWHRAVKGKRYHEYGCPECGHTWLSKGRYPLWPISFFARWKLLPMRDRRGRLRWDRLLRWSRHWVEVGGDGPEQRIHCTIVQWLFLGIRFGPMYKNYRSPKMYIPDHGWYPREMGERIVKHLAEHPIDRATRRYVSDDATYRRVDAP